MKRFFRLGTHTWLVLLSFLSLCFLSFCLAFLFLALGAEFSCFFLVFSVEFCVWGLVSVSLTRRGVGGVFDKLEAFAGC